ncbi:MAG: Uma2 family endonuclease [Ignavibacteriales bacterium]|nr:Uma2 family endonuclease [Ignavibacteriales bacterium]
MIEIVSESTEGRDRGFKMKLYAREGVKEYWIADPAHKSIDVYQSARTGFQLFGTFTGSDELRSAMFGSVGFRAAEIWT